MNNLSVESAEKQVSVEVGDKYKIFKIKLSKQKEAALAL